MRSTALLLLTSFPAFVFAQTAALEDWKRIESVLTHPRCINCHTMTDFPRQGDERRRHQFGVVRGPDNKGAPGAQCTTCHQAANQAASGVPGAPGWHLAPLAMAWEAKPGVIMNGPQLCRTLLDPKKNHGMDLAKLEQHLAKDPFILWSWAPGADAAGKARTLPPIGYSEFLEAFTRWAHAGAPCPTQKATP
jgi:hypothetical protein